MDVVIRSVNQRFLDEVAFPAFQQGLTDSTAALSTLLDTIEDAQCHVQLEYLVERYVAGGWSEIEQDRWQEVVYRLLFNEWRRTPQGWVAAEEPPVTYAAPLDESLHLALMITDPSYPYWDPKEATRQREQVIAPPYLERGLPAFIAGLWEPFPQFPPGEILTTRGTNIYVPSEMLAIADWCHRPFQTVQEWNHDLTHQLRALMQREMDRLRPVDVPEAEEVISFWLGRSHSPPPLGVAFSGLGPTATTWVREIADLAAAMRRAAAREQGITCITTGGARSWY